MKGWRSATSAAELAAVHLGRSITVFSDDWQVIGILRSVQATTQSLEVKTADGEAAAPTLLHQVITLQVGPWTGEVFSNTPVLIADQDPARPTSDTH